MIQINIGIFLDACGISYTKKQRNNLEELLNIFIQKNIDKILNHFQQNLSYNLKGKNVVENVIEQKEFIKTEMKAVFDKNIALECNQTESGQTDLDPLEEVASEFATSTESEKNEFIPSSVVLKNVEIEFGTKVLEVENNEVDSEIRNNPYLEELDQSELNPVLKKTSIQNESDTLSEDIWGNWQDLCGDLDTKEFYCPVPIPKCAKLIFESKLLLQLHKILCHERLDQNMKIICPLCKHKPESMYKHLKLCEPIYNKVVLQGCPKCGKKFEFSTKLDKHRKNVRRCAHIAFKNHMKLHEQIKCDICQESFPRSELKEHMIAEHQEKVKCDICQESFPRSKLKGHMIVEHQKEVTKKGTKKVMKKDAPQFICEYCTKQWAKSSLLQKHIDSVHLKIKRYPCKECEKAYARSSMLKHHMLVEHGDGNANFQCDDCGKCFLTPRNLRTHKEISHGAKVLKCVQCFKMFPKKHSLDKHVKVVHVGKDHHCLDCDKHYTKHNYESHMKTVHTKNFQCDKCENSFGTNSHLLHHIANNHDGIKSYKCTLCPDSFASNGGLQNHAAHCHDLKRPFICSFCSQTFKLKEKLDHHIARKHEFRNCETCPYCEKQFSRLKAHKPICPAKNNGSHANRPKFECQNCDKIYIDKSSLNRHNCSLNRHLKNVCN